MTSKETLKQWCKDCEYTLSLAKQRCPFRSISNDYCDEYNVLLKDLEALEILKSHAKLTELNSVYLGYSKTIVIAIEPNDDGYEIVKRWLENEN